MLWLLWCCWFWFLLLGSFHLTKICLACCCSFGKCFVECLPWVCLGVSSGGCLGLCHTFGKCGIFSWIQSFLEFVRCTLKFLEEFLAKSFIGVLSLLEVGTELSLTLFECNVKVSDVESETLHFLWVLGQ